MPAQATLWVPTSPSHFSQALGAALPSTFNSLLFTIVPHTPTPVQWALGADEAGE